MSGVGRRPDAHATLAVGMCKGLWILPRVFVAFFLMTALAVSSAAEAQSAFTKTYRWDAMRRVTGEISASENGTSTPFLAARYTYDSDGQLTKIETGSLSAWQVESVAPANWPSNNFTVFQTKVISYDPFGHKIEERILGDNGQVQAVAQMSYDDADRLVCSVVRMNLSAIPTAGGNTACALGTQGSGANDFGPDRITKNIYNAAGQLLQARKAVGTSLEQAYVTYGWLNPATQQIEPGYTRNGKQEYVVDTNGNKAKYEYDGFDRLQKWIFPSSARPSGYNSAASATAALTNAGALNIYDYEQYGYDKNSNRTSLRKRDNQVIGYTYDSLNRMTYKGGTTTAGVDYVYNLRGLQLSALYSASGQGVVSSYDGPGRLKDSTTTMGGASRTLSYDYDPDGNRIKLTFPDLQYVIYGYDDLNRMKAIKENGGPQIATLVYDNQGRRSSLTGGISTSYGYDPAGRMANLTHDLAGTAQDVTYCMGTVSGDCAPSYNPASQILKRTISNDSYVWNGAYTVNRNYTINGLNQYDGAGTKTFDYDDNSNLINDGNTIYTYDSENRLLSASGGSNATLSYDPNGRLFQTTGSATTQFLYDGDALVGEYDGAGNLLRRYVHGSGVDEPLFWYEGSNLSNRRILRADHQGSIASVADTNGNNIAINSYDEYGIPASTNQGRFAYTGQIYLPDLKFYHYKARIYSPTLGRFLQTDPIGYSDQINLTAYVGNDPINNQDPTGLFKASASCAQFTDRNPSGSCWEADTTESEIYEQRQNFDGSTFRAAATGIRTAATVASGAIVADDVTGVGVADDVALALTVPVAGLAYLAEKALEDKGDRLIGYHYTDKAGMNGIKTSGVIKANNGKVYFTNIPMTVGQAQNDIFIQSPSHAGRGETVVMFSYPKSAFPAVQDPSVPAGKIHFGSIRNGRGGVQFLYAGPNRARRR